jgi:hypothetical protein
VRGQAHALPSAVFDDRSGEEEIRRKRELEVERERRRERERRIVTAKKRVYKNGPCGRVLVNKKKGHLPTNQAWRSFETRNKSTAKR